MTNHEHDAVMMARLFAVEGDLLGVRPFGNGHINDTFCAVFQQSGARRRTILQRVNPSIFKNAAALMENVRRVTRHLASKAAGEPESERRVLTLIPLKDGRPWHVDADGTYWRMYRFIEQARTYDAVSSLHQAFQAARAFGRFQALVADLPAPPLSDTIPDFHHTPKRFAALERAIAADVAERVAGARPEIAFALARKPIAGVLLDAGLPVRTTHNDTKINNVMLDEATGEGICVIDLDTVMPGLAPYDFGDMVRTATCPAPEDERDLSRVKMEFSLFEALVRGYLDSAGSFLTGAEKQLLAFTGKLITFEQGIRFLTDYLSGDTYYKTCREGQNLDRARAQFKLVESIERQQDRMERLVDSLAP